MAETRYSTYSSQVYEQYDSEDAFTPTDSYTAALKVDTKFVRGGGFTLINGGANTIAYKVLGTMKKTQPTNDSDTSWHTIKGETTLATGATAIESYDVEYSYIWVMAKNNTNGQANTLRVFHRGMN